MALRRRQRGSSKLEELLPILLTVKGHESNVISGKPAVRSEHAERVPCAPRAKITSSNRPQPTSTVQACPRISHSGPFRFLELPQEIRDEVYSYLVVRQTLHSPPILDATAILKNRKKRLAARKTRDRLNQQRLSDGKRPTCPRTTHTDPILHVHLLLTSQRLAGEAADCMYSKNWFAISLDKLPLPTFEVPPGWNLSRIKRLQVEVQLKDAIRMNRYVDWASFFSSFSSLQFLRIIPTLHQRYYEWANPEFCDWSTTPFVHKAFFRELLAAIPSYVDLKIGFPTSSAEDTQIQVKSGISSKFLWDMYMELGSRVDGTGKPLAVNRVVS
ncbi:hypothetical protein DDE82_004943 [Stemphylium lycopersici]|uniref:DUF7730 domain-containing protein n=1 Tax=Stemphylium lycopersici TaxID=183478 RepID=A0A364MTY3_STELY|nr:hypothetical protein TW65_03638 [Stemphylium lycopersici]RAR03403.1 hypothetical protein DDE83_008238 [Stemphylium lycopersici]RAR03856.1 hypothetical protein DDE82_004943 [Stemphylium lycopersici]